MDIEQIDIKGLREFLGVFLEKAGVELTLAHTEDWEGLYANGKLLLQGDSIDIEYLLPITMREIDSDWLDDVGIPPTENLDDLVEAGEYEND